MSLLSPSSLRPRVSVLPGGGLQKIEYTCTSRCHFSFFFESKGGYFHLADVCIIGLRRCPSAGNAYQHDAHGSERSLYSPPPCIGLWLPRHAGLH